MHIRQVFTLLFAAAAFAGPLVADPIPSYVATSASLTYTLLAGGFDTEESFSFAGPALNLSGSGEASYDLGTIIGRSINIAPGVPFYFSASVVDVDPGEGSISGTIGGVPGGGFPEGGTLSAPPLVFNVVNGAIPPITVPAVAAGTVALCADINCEFPVYQFTMDIPGILTVQVVNLGPVFDPLYLVGSAQFTPVPEPNSALPIALALAVSVWCAWLRRRLPAGPDTSTKAFSRQSVRSTALINY
jgi:hypothetical protein